MRIDGTDYITSIRKFGSGFRITRIIREIKNRRVGEPIIDQLLDDGQGNPTTVGGKPFSSYETANAALSALKQLG